MVAPKTPSNTRVACRTRTIVRSLGAALLLGLMTVRLFGGGNRSTSPLELYDATIFEQHGRGNATTKTTTTTGGSPTPVAPSSHSVSSSFVVLKEDDLPPAPSFNQTDFEIEYFTSMPECTPLKPSDVSFTLVTQLSTDRLWIMKHQCERWPSPLPMAISIYLPPHAQPQMPTEIRTRLEDELACDLTRMHVTLFQASPRSTLDQYPVNTLRNLALQSIRTSHAAYIDSDFLISEGLQDDLLLATTHVVANDTKAALVMPAFDYVPDCQFQKQKQKQQQEIMACLQAEWDRIPKRHSDLVALLDRKERPRVNRGFQSVHGKNKYHGTTMYKTWIQNQSSIISIPCIKTPTYEPYLAVRVCRDLPKFPEIFKGWGYNKITWIKILLKKLGYRLWQVPRGFVMHLPHEPSVSRKSNADGHPPEFDAYLDWLGRLPTHPEALPHCVDWKQEHGPLQN